MLLTLVIHLKYRLLTANLVVSDCYMVLVRRTSISFLNTDLQSHPKQNNTVREKF